MSEQAVNALSGICVGILFMLVADTASAVDFDLQAGNMRLHTNYDAIIAPYREANPPPLPPHTLVVGGTGGPRELILQPGDSLDAYDVVFVINDGRILVTGIADPPVRITSKIVLFDNAEFIAWQANIDFRSREVPIDANDPLDAAGDGAVQFELADNASLFAVFSRISVGSVYPGYLRAEASGTSEILFAYNDFCVQNEIACPLNRSRATTEFFPFAFDTATITIIDDPANPVAHCALYEVNAGGAGTINLIDVQFAGAYFTVNAEVVDPIQSLRIAPGADSVTLRDSAGNGPTINAVGTTGLFWGFWIEPEARLSFEDSQFGLWLKLSGDILLDEWAAGPRGTGGVAEVWSKPEHGIELSFLDSAVIGTNTYFRGSGVKVLRSSVVGDSNCGGSGLCVIEYSTVTGNGGDISAVFGEATSIHLYGSHRLGFFARQRSTAVFHSTTIESHPDTPEANLFRASDDSLIVFENTAFAPPATYEQSACTELNLGEMRCEVEDRAAIGYAIIASPTAGSTVQQSQPVMGAAAITSLTGSPFAFDHYDLWLEDAHGGVRFLAQGATIQVGTPPAGRCRPGIQQLGELNVEGLSQGSSYTLHLDVFGESNALIASAEQTFSFLP